ncbi:MAG TPA: hypothetical protein DC049_14030, partial [Spirochaetia bacterium]|nr:hypothetical protein [Spirochaetia bacterium]
MRQVFGKYNIKSAGADSWFCNPKSCQYGDPLQVVFTDISGHPVTRDVKKFCALFAAPLEISGGSLEPLITPYVKVVV